MHAVTEPGEGSPASCPVLSCPVLSCPVLCCLSVTSNGGGRVELGSWTWEKSEAVVAKAPTGPPLIRLDKALVKSTRYRTVRTLLGLLSGTDMLGL